MNTRSRLFRFLLLTAAGFFACVRADASESTIFGVNDAPVPPAQEKALTELLNPKVTNLIFGSDMQAVFSTFNREANPLEPNKIRYSTFDFGEGALCRRGDLVFKDNKFVGVQLSIDSPPTPTVATLNKAMTTLIQCLGKPDRVMLDSSGGIPRHGIAFRWDKPDAIFLFFHYTGSGGYNGRFWVCSKFITERNMWNMKNYIDAPKEETMSELWKNWLQRSIPAQP